ncbi:SAM-dependent methyltransferase [Vibrio orientalis CIP 102891 = ATCC 33934]|uniref:SAM-dependent methyltransferase n=1 Tax=Vibrio orientalis CIP 102891 = ATCC 33934 TaxID=675816 RepID=C9QI27_VIBOR|nr:class I SAM-dependent methyltransferase [Vibrio orientalis]EEX92344.1 SAM-dependent methyltransferase [Vibrio orientalis CIP 102891 = ATCC 33934]EGU51831.1 SAM-dependent methyltransferase [Vibrio orientalis CIP 102891 = ATCC 33934]
MDENSQIWRQYYEKARSRPHLKRTELAVRLNESDLKVATDVGCGTGSDIEYLEQQGFQVHGFDINPDSVAICRDRFKSKSLVDIVESSFESFDYPKSAVVIANSSLFFVDPDQFEATWSRIKSSIEIGGVFAGDFMGFKDSWAKNYRSPTTTLSESEVKALLSDFEIVRFFERDENAKTSLGRIKHWHTYSVVAVKRT